MKLYDYQKQVLQAIADGKHLIKAECSAGKTLTSLMWAKSTGKDKVLVVATASCRDSALFPREIEKFSDEFGEWYKSLSSFTVVSWSGLAKWTTANWNSLEDYAIIFDECLPGDTPVQTNNGSVQIADLKVGDMVLSYNEQTKQTEYKRVTRLIKKSAPDEMYCLRSHNGAIISTGNHPHFTQRGWIPASEIKVGGILYELCDMQQTNNQSELQPKTKKEVGKTSILQLRLRNGCDNQEQSSEKQTNGDSTSNQEVWQICSVQPMWKEVDDTGFNSKTDTGCVGTRNHLLQSKMFSETSVSSIEPKDEKEQSFSQTRSKGESSCYQKGARSTAYMDSEARAERWQWKLQPATDNVMGSTMQGEQGMGNGTTSKSREEDTRLSNLLQTGHREHLSQDRNRMRWAEPQLSSEQEERQEEGRQVKGVRVESVEILKREDIKRHQLYREPDYVYCIDVEDNHNFFANSFLTHNCQRGKAGISSNQGKAFLQICKRTDCWTGWTATPGDKWEDYYAYFTATGHTRNKTDFRNRFCIYMTHPFPKLIGTQNEAEYMAIKDAIWHEVDSSEMEKELPETIHQTIKFKQPTGYKQLMKTHEYNGEFLDNTSALAHAARRLCGSKQKLDWLADFVDGLDGSCIVFYSYETEREAIEKALKGKVGKIWNINGKQHNVPTEDTIGKHDVVLAQWQAGAFGLNLQFMNYWVSFSPNYSYTISEQARKRIHRKNQKNVCKYWYLVCENTIDEEVYKILREKKDFDEELWQPN